MFAVCSYIGSCFYDDVVLLYSGIPDYEPDGHQMEATHQVHHRPFDTTE